MSKFVQEQGFVEETDSREDEEPTMISEDMKIELERKEWEQKAQQELKDIHYNTKKEIRTMGVGFYKFSTDEEERRKEMEELKKMRDSTLQSRRVAQDLKQSKKDAKEERRQLIMAKRRQKEQIVASSAQSVDEFLNNLSK